MELQKKPTQKIASSFSGYKPRKTLKNREKINPAKALFNPYNANRGLCDNDKRAKRWALQSVWVYGAFNWCVPVLEGAFLFGRERGMWRTRVQWFEVLARHGNSYTRQSYYKFLAGQFRYISNEFITVNLYLTGLTIVEAFQHGFEAAQKIKEHYQ